MDSFEFNKIAGAVLAALLVFFGAREVAGIVFTEHAPEKPGYVIAVAESSQTEQAGAGKVDQNAPEEPIAKLLASADAARGEKQIKKCVSCHTFEKGGKDKVGPHLWGIVNRKKAASEGYAYSAALKEKGGEWSFENLNAFLKNPKTYLPKTKMVFNGIDKPADRADLIMYLRTLADTPAELPK